jgi:hypothetical protein
MQLDGQAGRSAQQGLDGMPNEGLIKGLDRSHVMSTFNL